MGISPVGEDCHPQVADGRLNRESERIPRRLRRGKRANHKKDCIPYGRRLLAACCGDLQFV
jgi:hypothetical protein